MTANRVAAVGQPLARVNDEMLLRGGGRYVADLIDRADCLHVAMVRSPHAHARLLSIDLAAASASPGVVAVITAGDLHGIADVPIDWVPPGMSFRPEHPVLARDVVRYCGQVVAAVCADTRQHARAAADAIAVGYEPLPAAVDQEDALAPGAPLVHAGMPDNRYYTYRRNQGDVDAAFAAAEHVLRRRFTNSRVVPAALEPRAALSAFDPATGRLVHTSTSQLPHSHWRSLAQCLGLPMDRLRFVVPDVGGGFGAKLGFYADDVICAVLSMRTGRPCAWIEGRAESFLSTTHGRDHVQYVELAATRQGVVTGLRCRLVADVGAYGIGMGPGVPAINAGHNITGQYRIGAVAMETVGVATQRTPTGPYRGAGHPEATFLIERALDELAVELGIDPVALRRRNYVQPSEMPYMGFSGVPTDSGDFGGNLDAGLALADMDALQAWRAEQRAAGRHVGIGHVALLRHVIVDDCGRIINPMLAEGQVHGGAVQGIGQALMEAMPFSAARAALVAGLDDYAMPHAGDLPSFETGHTVTATKINPLGTKGVGEGATIGASPALVNAVLDALRPLGVREVAMPMTPMTVWRAIDAAREAA